MANGTAGSCDPSWSCCVCHEPSALSHDEICHLFAPLVRCSAMLPAARDRREHALDAALERIGGRDLVDARSSAPAHRETSSPDARVTAIRRLAAVAAQYTPFPDALDARLTGPLAARGITEPYPHQGEAIENVPR